MDLSEDLSIDADEWNKLLVAKQKKTSPRN